jgi:hypothetical protein
MCHANRRLALEQARKWQPFRSEADFHAVSDALEISTLCAGAEPTAMQNSARPSSTAKPVLGSKPDTSAVGCSFAAAATAGALERAVAAARATPASKCATKTITLASGIHYLNDTLVLTAKDSGTIFVADIAGSVWISGGKRLAGATWTAYANAARHPIIKTTVPASFGHGIPGLFTVGGGSGGGGDGSDGAVVPAGEHRRLIRARYPNSDTETVTWGFASPSRLNASVNASAIIEWHKPVTVG